MTQISWFLCLLCTFEKKNEKCTLFNMFCPQQPVDEWEGHFEFIMLIIIIIIKVIMCGLISKTLVQLLFTISVWNWFGIKNGSLFPTLMARPHQDECLV